MSALALDWLELAVRWIHVIAGIAWIGMSFYFNWLNDRLEAPAVAEPGVEGELWSVHGGGFYRAVKYELAPPRMPDHLHWFKWEAYLTWITGLALLVLVYYLGAEVYLLDPGVSALGPTSGILLGIGALVGTWLIYDALCRSPLGRCQALLAILMLLVTGTLAYGLTRAFGGRAAYIHVGAALGTIMAANVFFQIIPAQKEMVDAVREGGEPDAARGKHAAMRSRHNNYFTLPVLFVMISSHYPMTYGHAWSWLILLGLFLIGAGTRHSFNLRNEGRPRAWILPAMALALLALAWIASSARSAPALPQAEAGAGPVSFQEVRGIIAARCSVCHAAQPSSELFDAPPAGIAFDTPDQIRAQADLIRANAVDAPVMPLGNLTGMTDEERAILGRWIREGASIDN